MSGRSTCIPEIPNYKLHIPVLESGICNLEWLLDLLSADNFTLDIGSDDDGLGIGVVLDRFVAMLLAEATLLDPAERQLVVNDLRRVDPSVTGFDMLSAVHRAVDVARPDRRAETEDRAIRLLDRLI